MPPALRVMISDWPPMSVTSVSPGRSSCELQPTTTQLVRSTRSRSSSKNSGEV
ncbi:MAG: hypothetical protein ACJ740_12925 [Gaiellales bacterium]